MSNVVEKDCRLCLHHYFIKEDQDSQWTPGCEMSRIGRCRDYSDFRFHPRASLSLITPKEQNQNESSSNT